VKTPWETKYTNPKEYSLGSADYEKNNQAALEISKFRKTPITMRKIHQTDNEPRETGENQISTEEGL